MAQAKLEARISQIGGQLARRVSRVVAAIPGSPAGPVRLARAVGIDKVLASRLLRAAAGKDPVAVLKMMPGPEPLRRFASAAAKAGVARELVEQFQAAVAEFDELIRTEAGDRSGLDAILSAWLPEARQEFELRRKQAVYRAMSQLKGSSADVLLQTVFIHRSQDDPDQLDLVWVMGLLGLQRLRPDCMVKFASRRVAFDKSTGQQRRPETLDGTPIEGYEGLLVQEFCSRPLAPVRVHPMNEVVYYTLGQNGFGPPSATDLVFVEVNRHELPRTVPPDRPRKRWVSAEITVAAKILVFDALVHRDLNPTEPELFIYDTSFDGLANVNDPARDIDRMDLAESVQSMGTGIGKFRTTDVPWYPQLLSRVCQKLGWDGNALVGYRCRIDYPLYGSQVAMAWNAPVQDRG
ncbi:hypothetical protein [Fontivita pretiosa]|uniref:hypothetical protein n=1 Tax=Fontivita pretiosa TaxID=2989684 RepID=UPI003D16DEED